MSMSAIDPRVWTYLPFILLALALLIGVPLAYRAWRDLHADDEPTTGSELFSDLERAYAEGKMTDAEFRRIREKLIGLPPKGAGKSAPVPPRAEPGRTPGAVTEPPAPGDPGGPLPSPDPHPET